MDIRLEPDYSRRFSQNFRDNETHNRTYNIYSIDVEETNFLLILHLARNRSGCPDKRHSPLQASSLSRSSKRPQRL